MWKTLDAPLNPFSPRSRAHLATLAFREATASLLTTASFVRLTEEKDSPLCLFPNSAPPEEVASPAGTCIPFDSSSKLSGGGCCGASSVMHLEQRHSTSLSSSQLVTFSSDVVDLVTASLSSSSVSSVSVPTLELESTSDTTLSSSSTVRASSLWKIMSTTSSVSLRSLAAKCRLPATKDMRVVSAFNLPALLDPHAIDENVSTN